MRECEAANLTYTVSQNEFLQILAVIETVIVNLLDSKAVYASPAFYVQQGDVIYVTPNEKRQRESTVNGNNIRSSSFWLSLASLATSVAVLIFK